MSYLKNILKIFSIKHKIFTNTIKSLDIIIFFRQFATLISSNIPIIQSIEMLQQTQSNVLLKSILLDLKYSIERGNSFSYSLNKFLKYFDEMTCFLLSVGEKSGTFETMLKHIANHKEKTYQFNQKIKQVLFYPMMISLVALIVCLIMFIFIVPRFKELFQETHVALPKLTLLVIHSSELLQHYAYLILAPFILYILLFREKIQSPQVLYKIQLIRSHIPIIGSIFKLKLIINFTRYLAITLKAGLPINDAIPLIAKACQNYAFEYDLLIVRQSIDKGNKISYALQKNGNFPNLMIEMIKIGEESGTLDDILEKISILYENELDQLTSYLSQLLEPLIMAILGVLIGGLVIAMYLPIFKLGTTL